MVLGVSWPCTLSTWWGLLGVQTERVENQDHDHSITSKINLVDLAGSERQSQAQTSGERLRVKTLTALHWWMAVCCSLYWVGPGHVIIGSLDQNSAWDNCWNGTTICIVLILRVSVGACSWNIHCFVTYYVVTLTLPQFVLIYRFSATDMHDFLFVFVNIVRSELQIFIR